MEHCTRFPAVQAKISADDDPGEGSIIHDTSRRINQSIDKVLRSSNSLLNELTALLKGTVKKQDDGSTKTTFPKSLQLSFDDISKIYQTVRIYADEIKFAKDEAYRSFIAVNIT